MAERSDAHISQSFDLEKYPELGPFAEILDALKKANDDVDEKIRIGTEIFNEERQSLSGAGVELVTLTDDANGHVANNDDLIGSLTRVITIANEMWSATEDANKFAKANSEQNTDVQQIYESIGIMPDRLPTLKEMVAGDATRALVVNEQNARQRAKDIIGRIITAIQNIEGAYEQLAQLRGEKQSIESIVERLGDSTLKGLIARIEIVRRADEVSAKTETGSDKTEIMRLTNAIHGAISQIMAAYFEKVFAAKARIARMGMEAGGDVAEVTKKILPVLAEAVKNEEWGRAHAAAVDVTHHTGGNMNATAQAVSENEARTSDALSRTIEALAAMLDGPRIKIDAEAAEEAFLEENGKLRGKIQRAEKGLGRPEVEASAASDVPGENNVFKIIGLPTDARKVVLRGNFTAAPENPNAGWEKEYEMQNEGGGMWSITLPEITLGRHEYKYFAELADGSRRELPESGIGKNYIREVKESSAEEKSVEVDMTIFNKATELEAPPVAEATAPAATEPAAPAPLEAEGVE